MARSSSAVTNASSWSSGPCVQNLAARIAKIAGAVEVAVIPRRLHADAVVGADIDAVRNRRRRLLQGPEMVAEPPHGGRGIEDHLGAVHGELAPAFGEVPVVADIDADLAERGLEHRIADVAGLEVELLAEAHDVGDVNLSELAEVTPVGVDHGGGVVVDAGLGLLVDRHHHRHAEARRLRPHPLDRRPVGHPLGGAVPAFVLLRADVRQVEELLEPQHLHAVLCGLLDEGQVGCDHLLADLLGRIALDVALEAHLYEPGLHHRHRPNSPAAKTGSLARISHQCHGPCGALRPTGSERRTARSRDTRLRPASDPARLWRAFDSARLWRAFDSARLWRAFDSARLWRDTCHPTALCVSLTDALRCSPFVIR